MKKTYTLLGLFFTLFAFAQAPTVLWNYSMPEKVSRTNPAIAADGTIYIACNYTTRNTLGAGNTEPNFFAVNSDGTLKWQASITEGTLFDKVDAIEASPSISPDGFIYIGGHFGRRIYRFNPSDGSFITRDLGARIRYAAPAFASNGDVYVPTRNNGDRGVRNLKADFTSQNWVFGTGVDFNSTPAVASDGTIYAVGTNSNIYAINPDGSQKWVATYGVSGFASSAIALANDGTIYLSAKQNAAGDGVLKAYNSLDGTEKWSVSFVGENAEQGGPAVADDGTVYLGNRGGKMQAFNPNTGAILWTFTASGGIEVAPAIDNFGRIYFGTITGDFYVLNNDGTEAYDALDLGDRIDSSAAIGLDGTIYVASTTGTGANSGKLYALQTTATGLATSHWPMYGKSAMHTSNVRHFWTGATSTDWSIKSNWDLTVPSSGSDVAILAGLTNYPTASSSVTVGSVIINSGASLIAQDAFTGSITYNRNLPTLDSWYLVSSPVAGETIENLIANNTFASGTAPNIGFSTFNNSGSPWTYSSLASSGSIVNGKGYSVRLAAPGNISFSGTINTADVTFALTQGTNNYNLLGNPFTSYINSTTFLTNEAANVELTFWMWNGTSYDTRTTGTSPNFKIAPGQAFFVEAKNTNNVTFTEALQSHETTDTFQKSTNERPEIKLMLSDATQSRKLEVFYIDGTTKGFDNGFDGKMFGGIADTFSLYSELVSENVGTKYAIQSLPNSDFETMIVPVGVKATAGKEITFTADAINLPEDVKVFLEDRATNTITRLDEANASYKVTLNDALNGTGRFFLHTKSSAVLSTDDVVLQNTSVYAINNNTLRVVGLPSGNANVKMYSILGKQVMQTSFSSTGVKDISLPKLSTGMYIIQVETATGKLNKKIVLE